jgi:hypothetical protein
VGNVLSHIFGEAHADGESDKLIASVTKQAASQHREWSQPKAQDIPAADLHKMLSQRQGRDKASVMINGVEYVAKVHDVMYQVSNHKQTTLPLALIDRGANGGVAGSDTWLIDKSLCSVHIQGAYRQPHDQGCPDWHCRHIKQVRHVVLTSGVDLGRTNQ